MRRRALTLRKMRPRAARREPAPAPCAPRGAALHAAGQVGAGSAGQRERSPRRGGGPALCKKSHAADRTAGKILRGEWNGGAGQADRQTGSAKGGKQKAKQTKSSASQWWTVAYQIRTIQIGEFDNSGSAFVVERHNNLIIKGMDFFRQWRRRCRIIEDEPLLIAALKELKDELENRKRIFAAEECVNIHESSNLWFAYLLAA